MPSGNAGLRHVLLFLLIVSLTLAAQQQQPHQQRHTEPQDVVVQSSTARRQHDTLHTRQVKNQKKGKDTAAITPRDERALATFAPEDDDVLSVVARPARSSHNDLSRPTARSLQDWQVEDIILLATVDGKIYARERYTGEPRWELEVDRPMVQTTYHKNKSSGEIEDDDMLWVVEPSQDGALYVYSPYAKTGMQRLAMTVKQLVDQFAPWATDDPPVVYTADKKNILYTIDASNGNVLKMFSSAGSVMNTDRSCQKVNALESLDDQECELMGTLTLGRTEYTVGIQDKNSGEPICTISYFEWTPNNRDRDLQIQYASTPDDRYIYSKYDGGIMALQHHKADHASARGPDPKAKSDHSHSLLYSSKFTSPVARVYDVVRLSMDETEEVDPSLVVLPQPVGPVNEQWPAPDNIFVNCTEGGSLYALSEQNYPLVTDGASRALCYVEDLFITPTVPGHGLCDKQQAKLIGVHPLFATDSDIRGVPMIGPSTVPAIGGLEPRRPTIDGPEKTRGIANNSSGFHAIEWQSTLPSPITILLLLVGLLAVPQSRAYLNKMLRIVSKVEEKRISMEAHVQEVDVVTTTEAPSGQDLAAEEDEDRKVRFPEPAEETIFPAEPDDAGDDDKSDSQTRDPSPDSNPETVRGRDTQPTDNNASPAKDEKKKARRGVRGGRKLKEKKLEQEQAQQRKRNGSQSKKRDTSPKASTEVVESPPDAKVQVISVDASESPGVSGKLQINNLVINTDRLIGRGSAGTCVFEGTFGVRDVAVKRMLSQYYELASQEVVFLQENDDHANVVRYYCQEKDQNFLYIAVELCQASLWDLFNPAGCEAEKREENTVILHSIQRDVYHALYQIVLGLSHLHSRRIIHRDIKPQNILIARPTTNKTEPRLLISDFGLCKTLPENVSTLIDPTNNAGTCGWKAPELISQPKDNPSLNGHSSSAASENGLNLGGVKRAADIFSLGCLFFWVLTGGSHPFDDKEGWAQMRELNIKKNKPPTMDKLDMGCDTEEPRQLIERMLKHEPELRPNVNDILTHPFFWPPDERLAFLCDVSDHFERETRDPPSESLQHLESFGTLVIEKGDFLKMLPRDFVDTLGKQRKYTGSKMLDLLRALRNKRNHYEDLPDDIKRRIGAYPVGYLEFWTTRFPKLLMTCDQVVKDLNLENTERFRRVYRVRDKLDRRV